MLFRNPWLFTQNSKWGFCMSPVMTTRSMSMLWNRTIAVIMTVLDSRNRSQLIALK